MSFFRIILSFIITAVSFGLDADVVYDTEAGQFIKVTGQDPFTVSSYALEDHDVSFREVLKLNASSLYEKNADLTGGIKGTVEQGGWIDLKAYVYDIQQGKHLVYHARLDEDSSTHFSPGDETVYVKIFRDDQTAAHPVNGANIKQLLQDVDELYQITKEDLDHLARSQYALQHHIETQRSTRGWKGFLAGVVIVGAIGAVVGGIVLAPLTGGTSLALSATGGAIVGGALLGFAGGLGGYAIENAYANSPNGNPPPQPQLEVPVAGDTDKEDYTEVTNDRPLYPMGNYPVQVVLEIKKAQFISAKIPGIVELNSDMFWGWNTYPPGQLKHEFYSRLWTTEPGGLDEGNQEVNTPGNSASNITVQDASSSSGLLRITVNPASSSELSYVFYAGVSANATNAPDLQLGDHVMLEVLVPIARGQSFSDSNPAHYPKLENFPFSWMAFFSGEALFQFEASVQPGEWRPWLGYDSQVHGTAMRKYPLNFNPKFYDWHVDTSISGIVLFRWTTKLTRRMSADKSLYSAVHNWPKKKSHPVSQRNNQKEGLNMELLRAWKDHTQGTERQPDFASYDGNRILPGLDPDEFLYLRDSNGDTTDIITLDSEPWKHVPTDEAANPLNDIVTAYKKNRIWHVDGLDYRNIYGADYASNSYEIQDMGTGESAPDGNGTGNDTAPGHVIVQLPSIARGNRTINMKINVDAPLATDKGFYGNISGIEHPATWETGIPYLITGLEPDEAENYAVSFIYENSLGRRKYYNFFSEHAPEHIRNHLQENGNWLVLLPTMLGYGYYTVNLWYRNPHYTDSWTRIGGKELLDISLRFVSVPGSLAGGAEAGYPGVDLMETPGDGSHIYLQEFLDHKRGNFGISKFNRYAKTHARTYVFLEGDTSTFEVFDSDPHTFTHRGTEWYLSSRTQAKQITDEQLDGSLKFYVDPIKSNGKVTEDNSVDGTGKKFTHEWNSAGIYQLKAVYKGTISVAHRIVVVDPSYRQNNLKADISKRRLTEQEKGWLRNNGVVFSSNYPNLLSIDNVDSIYRYIDGPRMHTGNQINRFHPGLDYADGYKWRIGPQNSLVDYDPSSQAPSGLVQAIAAFKDGEGWLPSVFVRHTSEKNSNGAPMPDDITQGSVNVSGFSSLNSNQQTRIEELFNDVPEPWQMRLPWISFVTDPNPYGTTDVLSYRTRTNIKVIYDMESFFDNDNGTFSGSPTDTIGSDDSYQNLVDLGIYLHLMDDDTKLKRKFYQDLATGRMILYNANSFDAQVSNAKDDGTVIADYSTSD